MKITARLLAGSLLVAAAPAMAADAPAVVASFKPLHSLVAGVMQGVGEPDLLIGSNASPHVYTLKPSNAAQLAKAKVVFWIGPGFETFLEKPLAALASGAVSAELSEAPGITLLDLREGGTFEAHDHGDGHDHEAHDHDGHDYAHGHEDGKDMHFWLDPDNARAMTKEIVNVLAKTDPANAETYSKNGAALDERLITLDKEIVETLAPVRDRPFIVFHDAYRYMENHYGLTVAGSITINPETMPGAARVKQVREKIASLGATCVFSEPNFEPKIVSTLIEGTRAKAGELNPEGGTFEPGPDLYFELMRANAASLKNCLGAN